MVGISPWWAMGAMNTHTASRIPSFPVIEAVAACERVDPRNPPLLPEALDGLFTPRLGGREQEGEQTTFVYYGYKVIVEADGTVTIKED